MDKCLSNEYPRYMFKGKIKTNVYPCIPQFDNTKVGCKGVYITWAFKLDVLSLRYTANLYILYGRSWYVYVLFPGLYILVTFLNKLL